MSKKKTKPKQQTQIKEEIKNEGELKNKDELKNEGELKNEDDIKNKDELKNEDELKNKDELKNEDELKNKDELKNEVKGKKRFKKLGFWLGIAMIVAGVAIIAVQVTTSLSDSIARNEALDAVKEAMAANVKAESSQIVADADINSTETAGEKELELDARSDSDKAGNVDVADTVAALVATGEAVEASEALLSGSDNSSETAEAFTDEPEVTEEEEEDDEDEDPSTIEINEANVAANNKIFSSSRLKGKTCIGTLYAPSIDLVYAVLEGVSDNEIGYAIGHFPDSVGIGKKGNCALAGHNGGKYGRYFGDIDDMVLGDVVIMTDLYGRQFTYTVCDIFIVEPTEYDRVVGDVGEKGKFLTMMTCCEGGTKRYVVRAKVED